MSAVVRTRRAFSGLHFLQLVRQIVPNHGQNDKQLLAELDKHVRFRAYLSYENPKHELAYIDTRTKPVEIYLNQHTLSGLLGPLPAPYMELCYERQREGDSAMAKFLDIFNHRLNALRYWMMSRSTPESSSSAHKLSLPGELLNAINGDPCHALTPRKVLGLAALLHDTQRSHSTVQLLLQRLLGLPVRLESFQGGWLPLAKYQQMQLGRANSCLGSNSVLGSHFWDQHKALKITIDMPDYRTLVRYLPPRTNKPKAGDQYTWFSGLALWLTHFRYDLNICFRLPKKYKALPLSAKPRLGYSSWMKPGKKDRQAYWHIQFIIPAQAEADHERLH